MKSGRSNYAPTNGRRALGYVRADDEIGMKIQEDAIWNHCRQQGLVLEHLFRDEGENLETSDPLKEFVATLSRPGLAHLAAMPLKDDVTVVVFQLDRFSPNPILQEGILLLLTGSGATVASCTPEDADLLREPLGMSSWPAGLPTDPTRRMIRIAIETGADVLPLIMIRDQEAPDDGQEARVHAREVTGSPSEHARLVRSRNPRASLRRIGRELEDAGYRRSDGAPWHPEQVRRMLQSA